MSKEQENLRDKFEEETNLKCWSEPHFEDVGFSDKYVEWLEKQLLLYNVVGRSEQLVCEICELHKVKEKGDWCDRCLEDATWSTN